MRRSGMPTLQLVWKIARTPLRYSTIATWLSTMSLSDVNGFRLNQPWPGAVGVLPFLVLAETTDVVLILWREVTQPAEGSHAAPPGCP